VVGCPFGRSQHLDPLATRLSDAIERRPRTDGFALLLAATSAFQCLPLGKCAADWPSLQMLGQQKLWLGFMTACLGSFRVSDALIRIPESKCRYQNAKFVNRKSFSSTHEPRCSFCTFKMVRNSSTDVLYWLFSLASPSCQLQFLHTTSFFALPSFLSSLPSRLFTHQFVYCTLLQQLFRFNCTRQTEDKMSSTRTKHKTSRHSSHSTP